MVAAFITSYIPPMLVAVPAFVEARTSSCACTMRMLHMIHSFDIAMKSINLSKNKPMSWIAPFVMKFNSFLLINIILWMLSFIPMLSISSTTLAFNEQAFADFVLIMIAVRFSAVKFAPFRTAITALKSGVVATSVAWKKAAFFLARLTYYKLFALARVMAVFGVSHQLSHPFIRFVAILTLLEFNCVFTHFVVHQKRKADGPFCRKFMQSVVVAWIVTFIPALRILVIVLMFDRHVLPCLKPFMALLPKWATTKKAAAAKKSKKN